MDSIQLNVNLNFKQLLDAIKHLTPKEKLQLNEALWENNMDIPLEHQQLVLDRQRHAKENPSILKNWDEVSKQLKP